MKKKRILALFLAAVSCLSLAVSASAAGTTTRKATDFKDYDRSAWYAEAVRAAVDNGLLYGKSSTIIDPNGDMTRAEMAAIINRSFGCYKAADISQYKDVSKNKWYYKDVALAVQTGEKCGERGVRHDHVVPVLTDIPRQKRGGAEISRRYEALRKRHGEKPHALAETFAAAVRRGGHIPAERAQRGEIRQMKAHQMRAAGGGI